MDFVIFVFFFLCVLLHIVDVEFGRLLIGLIFDLGRIVRFFWASKSGGGEESLLWGIFRSEDGGRVRGFPQSGHTRVGSEKRKRRGWVEAVGRGLCGNLETKSVR